MKKVNLGVIGAGNISKQHLKAAVKMEEINLVSIADISKERAEVAAKEFSMKPYTDYIEMLDNEKLDAVIITLPHSLHKSAALEAIKRGVNVLIEKPMAISVQDCDEIINSAKKNNVKVMVGHVVHYGAANITAKKIHDSGELGKLVFINDARYEYFYSDERLQNRSWFLRKDLSGGGVVMNVGVHSIDAVQWVTGSKVKKVFAKVTNYKSEFDVEGSAQILLWLENGVSAVISLNGYNKASRREIEYVYEKGTVKVAGRDLYVAKEGQKELQPIAINADKSQDMIAQLREFAGAILENRTPSIPGEYGKSVIAASIAVYESSETGKMIEI